MPTFEVILVLHLYLHKIVYLLIKEMQVTELSNTFRKKQNSTRYPFLVGQVS